MCCAWVRTFVNRHACVTFWVHSWPTTANSKPDSPWIPTRLFKKCDVGASGYVCHCSRHRGVEWMVEMCDRNSIFACFDAMLTQMSHDHPGYRSWFHFNWTHWFRSRILKMLQQWRWQHVQPLRVLAIQNTRATIVVQSQRQAVTC